MTVATVIYYTYLVVIITLILGSAIAATNDEMPMYAVPVAVITAMSATLVMFQIALTSMMNMRS
jgi:hypothetical protein